MVFVFGPEVSLLVVALDLALDPFFPHSANCRTKSPATQSISQHALHVHTYLNNEITCDAFSSSCLLCVGIKKNKKRKTSDQNTNTGLEAAGRTWSVCYGRATGPTLSSTPTTHPSAIVVLLCAIE